MDTPLGMSPRPSRQSENVLECYMLKQGSRSRQFWHERYFCFRPDNTLLYYNSKGDEKPKGSLVMNELANCEVSDLFAKKFKHKLIYCMRITWAAPAEGGALADETVSLGNSPVSGIEPQQKQQHSSTPSSLRGSGSFNNNPLQHETPQKTTKSRRISLPRPLGRKSNKRSSSEGHRSVDGETLTLETTRPPRHDTAAPVVTKLEIPTLVEVDQRLLLPQTTNTTMEAKGATPQSVLRNRTAYEEERDEERDYLRTQYFENKRRSKRKLVQGTKLTMAAGAAVGATMATAGIGLVAGLVVLGVGLGGGAAMGGIRTKQNGEIVFGCHDYEMAKEWKSCLDAALESANIQNTTWGQLFAPDGQKTRMALFPPLHGGGSERAQQGNDRRDRNLHIASKTKWKPLEGGWAAFLGNGVQGLRIFREETNSNPQFAALSVDGKPCPPMKAHTVISASPLDAFLCLMSCGRMQDPKGSFFAPTSEQRTSFRIVENIDVNTDVIHLVFRPLYLFPSWTTPRDFVLYRYWRHEPDGSYIVCFESVQHLECPPVPGYVRGEMHQVVSIAPHKKMNRRAGKVNLHECFMTALVQIDPKGWVPTAQLCALSNQSYGDAFSVSGLMHLLDVRDAIDQDRFVPVAVGTDVQDHHLNSNVRSFEFSGTANAEDIARTSSADSGDYVVHEDLANYDFAYASRESLHLSASASGIASIPRPLAVAKWAEPDANSFRVRGKEYKTDRKKINAGPSIGRLIAVDVVEVDEPIYTGLTVHPTERVQLALQKEALLKAKGLESDMPPFIFAVNIVVPGPPFYHAVFYYAVDDISTINGANGTPSSRLCKEFFFGDCDEFRHRTFKLIPQIVQGNFIVRKAVGSTPAIMGKKLRQLYVRGDRCCEVILDCGSSPVATGVIRLSLGYAKTLVVDMGFLFEGDAEETLPERIFGSARLKHMDFRHLRKVAPPP